MQDPDDQRSNPPQYPDEDVSFVVDMLKRRDLIGGINTAEVGIIAAWLTDDGNDCAEKYNGDFQSYLTQRNGGGVTNQTTNHFNMDGSTDNQIATGPNAKQTMNVTPTSSELAQAVQGLVDLLAAQGVFTGREQEMVSRQSAVVEQFDQPVPDPSVVQSFLAWVLDCARQGTTGAVVAAVSLMSNDILHQLAAPAP